MDSDESHACAEVSIGSDYLFQSLVLILDDSSNVSTKGLVCVHRPDAEYLDSQGARCKPLTAPGIILKGLPACINVSWQTPVCKFSGIRYVPLSFLREPHSTDYELCTVLFSYDFIKQSHCTQYENMFTDRVDSDLKSIFLFCFCLNPNIIPNSSILYTALPARWRCP